MKTRKRRLSKDPENKVRRQRYRDDPAYRDHVLSLTRTHRERLKQAMLEVETAYTQKIRKRFSGPRGAALECMRYATVRKSADRKRGKASLCFTASELSGALDRHIDAVAQWANAGFIPQPDMEVLSGIGKRILAYSVPLAQRIALAYIQVCKSPTGHIRDLQRERLRELLR